MSEGRMSEGRMSEGRMSEGRMSEGRMSEGLAAADRAIDQTGVLPDAGQPDAAPDGPPVIERGRAELDFLWARGREFLGCELAIMGGAMTWVSERTLVAAISNAGGFGVIASGAMSPDMLDAEIGATAALTGNPFGVNLITLHPQLTELIDVCIARHVGHVVLAGGIPAGAAIQRLRDGGARVICFTPTLGLAGKLVRMGADAIVIEGSEAGGHIGPVSTAVLAQEVLPHLRDVPVFVAGGIGRGEAVLSYLEMGAAGVQLGTRFACAHESIAHPRFKHAFIHAAARDAVLSVQLDARFPVIPVRALANAATRRFRAVQGEVIERFDRGELSQLEAQLEIEHFWAGALRRAVIDGDVENGSLMAGQSVGMVKGEQSVAEILAELVDQALAVIAAQARRFGRSAEYMGSAEGRDRGG
jgi:enoyl-[acyl-carrier protein] reductase II